MEESEKQEANVVANGGKQEEEEDDDDEERLVEGMAVLDFDMLCATVAMQTQSSSERWGEPENGGGGDFGGGVQRMWEGEVFDCFDDRRIALETACCPCYRFGKNMHRAGFGACFLQGTVYFVLVFFALLSFVVFGVTKEHRYLYLAVAFIISAGTYLGFFRTRIRKQFNIKGRDSYLDDCMNHLICPCCTLCQEARTLDINNVQDGVWRGRGDTICIGSRGEGSKSLFEIHSEVTTKSPPDPCSMQKAVDSNARRDDHLWNLSPDRHSEPLVPSSTKV